MTFGLTIKGNLHDFLPDSAEIYETVLFKTEIRHTSALAQIILLKNRPPLDQNNQLPEELSETLQPLHLQAGQDDSIFCGRHFAM